MDRLPKNEALDLMMSAIDKANSSSAAKTQELKVKDTVYIFQVGKYWYAGISARIEVRATTENAALAKLRHEGYQFKPEDVLHG